MPRARSLSWAFGALGLVVAARVPAAETTPLSPEETVRRYLQALKDGRFDAAYDLISKAMKQGKDREVWVKEQKTGMAFADVKIFEFHVHPGEGRGLDGPRPERPLLPGPVREPARAHRVRALHPPQGGRRVEDRQPGDRGAQRRLQVVPQGRGWRRPIPLTSRERVC